METAVTERNIAPCLHGCAITVEALVCPLMDVTNEVVGHNVSGRNPIRRHTHIT